MINEDSKYGAGPISIARDEPRSDQVAMSARERETLKRADSIRDYFWRTFQNITNFEAANKTFRESVKKRLKFVRLSTSPSSMSEEAQDDGIPMDTLDGLFNRWRDRIEGYLQKKVEALRVSGSSRLTVEKC